jgi:hypothetical protein
MKSGLAFLALAMLIPLLASGQLPPVAAGARVRLTAPGTGFKEHVTTVTDVRGDSIVFGAPHESRSMALTDMTALDVSTGTRRHFWRGAGIGLGLGAVTGVALGAATYKKCVPQHFLDCLLEPESAGQAAAFGGFVLGGVGLVAGAVIGALNRTDRWTSVDLPVRAAVGPTRSGGVSFTLSRAL